MIDKILYYQHTYGFRREWIFPQEMCELEFFFVVCAWRKHKMYIHIGSKCVALFCSSFWTDSGSSCPQQLRSPNSHSPILPHTAWDLDKEIQTVSSNIPTEQETVFYDGLFLMYTLGTTTAGLPFKFGCNKARQKSPKNVSLSTTASCGIS